MGRAARGAVAEGALGCVFFLGAVCAEPALQTATENRAAQAIARANGDIVTSVQYAALREEKRIPRFLCGSFGPFAILARKDAFLREPDRGRTDYTQ